MAAADYAHCDGEPCLLPTGSTKVFYDADTDIPEGTVIMHAECAVARLAAAEQQGPEIMPPLLEDLRTALNRNSAENGSDTADFVLAQFLLHCLDAFDYATRYRASVNTLPPTAAQLADVSDAHHEGFGAGVEWADERAASPTDTEECAFDVGLCACDHRPGCIPDREARQP